MTTERLHLVQSSMKYSMGAKAATADVRELVVKPDTEDAPDVVGFTESPPGGAVRRTITRLARRRGWHVWTPPKGDCVFVVHPRHTITETGYVHVLDANLHMPVGNYGERDVAFVSFQTPAGNLVSTHGCHWLTAYGLDSHPGQEGQREVHYAQQTQAMIAQVVRHGVGSHLSFWQGDTNINQPKDQGKDPDALHAQFKAHGLTSVYDELGKYPATHGHATIDVIGSYDPDKRVSAVDVKVRPARHSDHRAVDAWYDVLPVGQHHRGK